MKAGTDEKKSCRAPNRSLVTLAAATGSPHEEVASQPPLFEAMIDQDDMISQQLSLRDQRGSKVIRGNLLIIPIDNSFVYVEPVYLIAEQTDIPQLKRVIVVYGKKGVMRPTLGEAIKAAFGVP